MFAGMASADQFLTKADERNGVLSPGGNEVTGGGASCGTAPVIGSLPFADSGTTDDAENFTFVNIKC